MTDDDDDSWRFSLEDIEERQAADGDDDGTVEGEEPAEGGNVAGSLSGLDEELEPQSPSLEGSFFVLLGALVTVLILLAMLGFV